MSLRHWVGSFGLAAGALAIAACSEARGQVLRDAGAGAGVGGARDAGVPDAGAGADAGVAGAWDAGIPDAQLGPGYDAAPGR